MDSQDAKGQLSNANGATLGYPCQDAEDEDALHPSWDADMP